MATVGAAGGHQLPPGIADDPQTSALTTARCCLYTPLTPQRAQQERRRTLPHPASHPWGRVAIGQRGSHLLVGQNIATRLQNKHSPGLRWGEWGEGRSRGSCAEMVMMLIRFLPCGCLKKWLDEDSES